jgi:hypothetical protein
MNSLLIKRITPKNRIAVEMVFINGPTFANLLGMSDNGGRSA